MREYKTYLKTLHNNTNKSTCATCTITKKKNKIKSVN